MNRSTRWLSLLLLLVSVFSTIGTAHADVPEGTAPGAPSPAVSPPPFKKSAEATPSARTAPESKPGEKAPADESSADEEKTKALAQAAQNPIANMISLPFQSNTNFGVGPRRETAEVLNIQPVIPQSLGEWNLIHRLIVPLQYVPLSAVTPAALPRPGAADVGLGDVTYEGFFSPAAPGKVIWGVGPIVTLPTASHATMGTGKWSGGPALVALTVHGHIVAGVLVTQQWSVAGDPHRSAVSSGLVQPFFNYNMKKGWYLTTSPIVTVDWNAPGGQKWTVPVGGGLGRIFRLGKQPMNASVQMFYNVVSPTAGPQWQFRAQLQFLFPTEKKE